MMTPIQAIELLKVATALKPKERRNLWQRLPQEDRTWFRAHGSNPPPHLQTVLKTLVHAGKQTFRQLWPKLTHDDRQALLASAVMTILHPPHDHTADEMGTAGATTLTPATMASDGRITTTVT